MKNAPAPGGSPHLRIATGILVLVGVLLTLLQFLSLRDRALQDALAVARVTAANGAAAVMFRDERAASETLSTLDAVADFRYGGFYDADGTLVSGRSSPFAGAPAQLPPLDAASAGASLSGLRVVEPMHVDARYVGALVLETGLERVYLRLSAFGLMFVLAAASALALAWPVVRRMRRQVEGAAARIREQASLLDKAQDAILVMTLDRRVTYWNKGAERLYQWRDDQANGRALAELVNGGDAGAQAAEAVVANGEWRGELARHRRDGSGVPVEAHWSLVHDDGGAPSAILAIETDITARKSAEARVSRLNRLRALQGGISSAVLRHDDAEALLRAACRVAVDDGLFPFACAGVVDEATGEGRFVAVAGRVPAYFDRVRFGTAPGNDSPASRAAREQRLVVCNDVALERRLSVPREALLAEGHRSIAACPLVLDGRTTAVLILCASEPGFFDDEEVALLDWARADLSFGLDHYEKAQRLDYLAYYDAVTGLANTHLFRDRLEQLINAATQGSSVCVTLVDIERFTIVNDTLGRDVGDDLLRAVGRRLCERLEEPFTVARISADTFAVAHSCASGEAATALRGQIQDALREPLAVRDRELHVAVQAGIALHPSDGQDAQSLFRSAEAALMEARSTGQPWAYYARELNVRMAEQLDREHALRNAIDQQEFELHYQPRVDLLSGRMVAAEALIRWRRQDGSIVGPTEFIQLAEETGLIVPIGEWVLRAACRQQSEWLAQGLPIVPVGVNFSSVQFQRTDVLQSVRAALDEFRLEGRHLEIELTESTAMERPQEAERILAALRGIGVRAALDDFGTGFSSLAHLKRFPLTAVKIDRTFINEITHSPDDAAIANAVIAMAHGMGLHVVAEGVETPAQMRFLRTKLCDEMQGFAFSRAVPAQEFATMLRAGTAMPMPQGDDAAVGTLLLVDDEAGIRNSIQRLLRRDGYRILQASGGEEALELLALHSVDVIVSDQRMPGMSGAEFLDIVRQLYPDTVRIILSGYTDLQVVTDGVNRGAVYRFLTKPWDDEALREEIRDAFRVATSRRRDAGTGRPASTPRAA